MPAGRSAFDPQVLDELRKHLQNIADARSATPKIGASASLLIAMMFFAPFIPTMCCGTGDSCAMYTLGFSNRTGLANLHRIRHPTGVNDCTHAPAAPFRSSRGHRPSRTCQPRQVHDHLRRPRQPRRVSDLSTLRHALHRCASGLTEVGTERLTPSPRRY